MAHRLAHAGIALAAAAILMLPTSAFAEGGHEHASPSADPHADHDDHDLAPAPQSSGDGHDHGASAHDDHDDHDATTEDDGAGHTDHGTEPDSVSPKSGTWS